MRDLSAAVLVIVTGVVSIAEAQPGWSDRVTTISTPAPAHPLLFAEPEIAVQPNGDAYAVWEDLGGGNVIKVARYAAARDSWDAPITLHVPGAGIIPEVAVDSAGNVFLVLMNFLRSGSLSSNILVIQYSPASGTTTTTTLGSARTQAPPRVVLDAAGNAMVVWEDSFGGLDAARYTKASGMWSPGVSISPVPVAVGSFDLAIDGLNNVTVAWVHHSIAQVTIVQARRFDSSTLTWGPVHDVAESNLGDLHTPRLAADAAGNVTAIWGRSNGTDSIAQAARFTKALGTWSSATDLSAPGFNVRDINIAADATGNVIGMWLRCIGDEAQCIVQTARFAAASASWGGAVDHMCPGGSAYREPALQVHAAGNGIALWSCRRSDSDMRITASR